MKSPRFLFFSLFIFMLVTALKPVKAQVLFDSPSMTPGDVDIRLMLPNAKNTPGVVDSKLTKEILCDKSFTTSNIRNVPESLKKSVYALYKTKNYEGVCMSKEGCEIDHLISLELGGANDIKNLWPQPYVGEWNAHQKDKLENRLHLMVCSGKIELQQAQKEISTNWIEAYKKYFK